MSPFLNRPRLAVLARILVAAAAGCLLAFWLIKTPPGLLGKADAIGFAVCHRIPLRSFHFAERQLPLCARCSGMYLGAFTGILYHLAAARKKGNLPAWKISIPLMIFAAAFAVDGLNSYVGFWGITNRLYASNNILRLASGTGLGLGMAALLMPVFNQTTWQDWQAEAALHSWRQLLLLLTTAAALDLLMISEMPFLLYPLAIISSSTVLTILTLVYSMVWMMILKCENRYNRWQDAGWMLLYGFFTAILQIAIMDLIRYHMTGTWNGFFINIP